MNRLTSKIQYKNFETGEFVEEKKRSFEELIEVIEQFPWERERDRIVIDLTNPSITIEGNNNDYLKLAVYFNRKFVLHYIDDQQILFDKSFVDIRDSYKYLEKYFTGTFDKSEFKKQNTWLIKNVQHFVSQDFRYTVTTDSIRKYLWSTSALNLIFSVVIIFIFLFKNELPLNYIALFFIFLFMLFLGGGINLILFFNYYSYCKDKILIMSKGNDVFYYGHKTSPVKYNKKDILQFTTIKSRSHRSPIAEFAIIKIQFKDGTIIKIPNLLVDDFNLGHKLFQYRNIKKGRFPFIKT